MHKKKKASSIIRSVDPSIFMKQEGLALVDRITVGRESSNSKDSTRGLSKSPVLPSGRHFNEVYSALTVEIRTSFSNLWRVPAKKKLQVEQCYNALVDTLHLHATEIATNELIQVVLLELVDKSFEESVDLGCLAFNAISDLTWKNPYEKRYETLNILYNRALKVTSRTDFLKFSAHMIGMIENSPISTSDFVNDHMLDLLENLGHSDLFRRAISCEILSFIIGTPLVKLNPSLIDAIRPACLPLELLQCALETSNEWYRDAVLLLLGYIVQSFSFEQFSLIEVTIAQKVNEYMETLNEESQLLGLLTIFSKLVLSPIFKAAPWNLQASYTFLADRDWSVHSKETYSKVGTSLVTSVFILFKNDNDLYKKSFDAAAKFLESCDVELCAKTLSIMKKILDSGRSVEPKSFVEILLILLRRMPCTPEIFTQMNVIRERYGDTFFSPVYNLLEEYMRMDYGDVNFGKLNSLLQFMGHRASVNNDYFKNLEIDVSESCSVSLLIRSLPLLCTLKRINQLEEVIALMYHDDIGVRQAAVKVVGELCDHIEQSNERGSPTTPSDRLMEQRKSPNSKDPSLLNERVRKAVNAMINVALADRDPSTRLVALLQLQPSLYPYLCEQYNLDALFVVMNDPYEWISDEALKLLCRLLHSNEEAIFPQLLKMEEYILQDLMSADVSLTFNLKKVHVLTVCVDQYCLLLSSASVENVVFKILSEHSFLSERFAIALLDLVTSILAHAGPYNHCDSLEFYAALMGIIDRRDASPMLRRAALETLSASFSTLSVADNALFYEVYTSLMRIIQRRAEEPFTVKAAAVKAISTVGALHPVKVRKFLVVLNAENDAKATKEATSDLLSPVLHRMRVHTQMDERYPSVIVFYLIKALSAVSVDHRHQMDMIQALYYTITNATSTQRLLILSHILPDLQVWLLDPSRSFMSDTILRLMTEFTVLCRQYKEIVPGSDLNTMLFAVQKFCAIPRASQVPTSLQVIQLLDELASSVPASEMRLHRWALEFIHQRLSQNKSESRLMRKVILALESFLEVIHERDVKLILPHVLQCMEPISQEIQDGSFQEKSEITVVSFHFIHCVMQRYPTLVNEMLSQIALKLIDFVDESCDPSQIDIGLRTLAHLFHGSSHQGSRFAVTMKKLCASKSLPDDYFAQLLQESTELRVDKRYTSVYYWSRSHPFKMTCGKVWENGYEFATEFSCCLRLPGPTIEVLRYEKGTNESSAVFSFISKKSSTDCYKVFCTKARDPRSTMMQVMKVIRVEQSMHPPTVSDPAIIDTIANIPSAKNKDREQSWITWFHSTCVLLIKHSPYYLIAKSVSLAKRNIEYASGLFCFVASAYVLHLKPKERERIMEIFSRVVELAPRTVQAHFFTLAVFLESERRKAGALTYISDDPITFTITRSSPTEKFGINYDEDPRRGVVVTKVAPDGLGAKVGVPTGVLLHSVNGKRIHHVSDIRTIIEGQTTIELLFYQKVEKRFVTSDQSLMDLSVLAKVSYETQRHSKSIYFNEMLFEELLVKLPPECDADAPQAKEILVVAERLFEFYAHLNFSAAAQGLAKVIARRFSSSVLQPDQFRLNEVSILEQLHWLSQALDTYRQRMVCPTGVLHMPAFVAILRCQESIGEVEMNAQLIKKYWEVVPEAEKKAVIPYRAHAAFLLGNWEEFDSIAEKPSYLLYCGDIQRCAYFFRRKKYGKLLNFVEEARLKKADFLSQCLNESYGRVCDTLVTLRHLRHFEELVSYVTCGPERKEMLRTYWSKRLLLVSHRPGDIFTQLAIQSLVIQPKEDYNSYVLASQALTKLGWNKVAYVLHKRLLGDVINVQSLLTQKPYLIHAYLKNMHGAKSEKEALLMLREVLSKVNVAPDCANAVEWGPCHHLLGEWIIRENPTHGEEAIIEVQKATELSPQNYCAFHSLGILHYDLSKDPDINEQDRIRHYVSSIEALIRSVELCSHNINIALQDLLRILTIWFSNVNVDEINVTVHSGIKQLQNHVWLSVIPQLIARISVYNKVARTILIQLLIRVGVAYPQALIYPLTVAEKSPDVIRRVMAMRVLAGIRGANKELVEQASLISNELVRIAILTGEKWHAAIQTSAATPNDAEALVKELSPIYKETEAATTPNEIEFKARFGVSLERAMYALQNKDLSTAWTLLKQLYTLLHRMMDDKSLAMEEVSPILHGIKETTVAVPGTFDHQKPLIAIREFFSTVYVLLSKQRPRRLGIDASNGKRYWFLLKGHEDMRQDERVMQFIGLIDAIFIMENSTSSLGLSIPMYAVVPLCENVGVVGWVENTKTIYKMLENSRKDNGISIYEEVEMIMKRGSLRSVEEYHKLPKATRATLLRYVMDNSPDDELRRIIWNENAYCEEWLSYRNSYGLTLAAMSMVGYVLGLGDRHLNNLMLQNSGDVVHIDFGDCFEVAMNRTQYAEAVPFRLTRLMIKALGVTGVDGVYRMTSEIVMKNLRKHSENLLSILEAFIYDPLINWRLNVDTAEMSSQSDLLSESVQTGILKGIDLSMSKSFTKAQQMVGGYTEALNATEEQRNEQGDKAWARVKAKLTGHDFSAAVPADNTMSMSRLPPDDEVKLCSSWISDTSETGLGHSLKTRVGAPLPTTYLSADGCSCIETDTLDVSKQVDRLIAEATNLDNLVEAFLTGWAPFW